MNTRTARVPAYAKLNFGLRILFKRPDGYHELRTVFQTISVADSLEIAFTPRRTTKIRLQGTPEIADNLVEKAASLVVEQLSIQGDIAFNLRKCIPTGAGLGGGSSDAAAVLIGLPVLAGKVLPPNRAEEIAAQLGSDVPFFLRGGTVLGLGRGEELYPLPDLAASRGLLVLPGIHSSTVEAYRALSTRLTSITLQNKLSSFQREVWRGAAGGSRSLRSGVAAEVSEIENDFEEVVFEQHPELRKIKERLTRLGAVSAAMSGSGSTIFGTFSDQDKLARAAKQFPDGKVLPFALVSRARYRSAWRRALRPHVEGNLWPPQSRYARSPSGR
jgi:4-diphosphocytidyl-2-C-methyl-D-erythritol kinase